MDYKESRLSGFVSLISQIQNAAKQTLPGSQAIAVDQSALAGLGGYSTALDQALPLLISPQGFFTPAPLNDPAVRQAIYQLLALANIETEAVDASAKIEQYEIAQRGSFTTQINMDDAINQMLRDYKGRLTPDSPLDYVRVYSSYWSGGLNQIDERFYGDRVHIIPKGSPEGFFSNLELIASQQDPVGYCKHLARWLIWDVHLLPLKYIEKDVESIPGGFTAARAGYPAIVPQAFKAVESEPLYFPHRDRYERAIQRFESLLYLTMAKDAMIINGVAQQKDLSLLQGVYTEMVNGMMSFIQAVGFTVNVNYSGSGTQTLNPNHPPIYGSFSCGIPNSSTGSFAVGVETASVPAPFVPVNVEGVTLSPVDALIYYYLKTIIILKKQEAKLAGALSKAMDPASTYVIDAAANDPNQNWGLTYDPAASIKKNVPVFVETSANLSRNFMTTQFGRQVTIADPNAPTVKDYNNTETLRNFYARSVPVPGGGTMSPKEVAAAAATKKKTSSLIWISAAVAAAALYYQYKG